MDPFATIGSRNFDRLKYNAEESRNRRSEFDDDDDDDSKDEEYFADMAEGDKRRRLSKIGTPDDDEENSSEKDHDSVGTNGSDKFWPDGSPLGIGPQFDDNSTVDSQMFNELDDSSVDQDDESVDDDGEDEGEFFDEDGNPREPYLWEKVRRNKVKAVYTAPLVNPIRRTPSGSVDSGLTVPMLGEDGQDDYDDYDDDDIGGDDNNNDDDDTVPDIVHQTSRESNGTVGTPTSRRKSSVKTPERKLSVTSSKSRNRSRTSIASTASSASGAGTTEMPLSGSDDNAQFRSKGRVSITPSVDISDDLDDDEYEVDEGGSSTGRSSIPLNLLSAIHGDSALSQRIKDMGGSRDHSARSSVTAGSDDHGMGTDYHPISAVDVSIVKGASDKIK